jgi:rubrerythrin
MTFNAFSKRVSRGEISSRETENKKMPEPLPVIVKPNYTYDAPMDETEILWKCLNCGELKPRNKWVLGDCPACGAKKSQFVLVDED